MTLLEEILNGPKRAQLASLVEARNDGEIARILSEGRTRVASRNITALTILAELGPLAGGAILEKLEAASTGVPALRFALRFLFAAGLDIGDPATQAMLDHLALHGVLTGDEAVALKNLAVQPTSVSVDAVSDVLNEHSRQQGA